MHKKNPMFMLNRRSLLSGLGSSALLATPLLRSIMAQAAGENMTRLVFIPKTHGFGGNNLATGTETSFTLKPWLSPLESLKQECIFIDGLLGTYWGNAHDVSYPDIFTGAVVPGENDSPSLPGPFPLPQGPSIDTVLGKFLNTSVLRMSAGYDSWGTENPVSFDENNNWLRPMTDPQAVFNAITNQFAPSQTTTPALNYQSEKRKKILDAITSDIKKLMAKVPSESKPLLEQHLQSISDTGFNLGLNNSDNPIQQSVSCKEPTFTAPNRTVDQKLNWFFDMTKTALVCGTHRVAMLGITGDLTTEFSWKDSANNTHIGNDYGNDFHHDVAHYEEHTDKNDRRLAYEASVRYFFEKVAAFAKSLEQTIDVDGVNMLRKTIIVVTGEVGDGQHDTLNKPYIIIGGGSILKTGRYLKIPTYNTSAIETPYGNKTVYGTRAVSTRSESDLWRCLANALGMQLTKFGLDFKNYGDIKLT